MEPLNNSIIFTKFTPKVQSLIKEPLRRRRPMLTVVHPVSRSSYYNGIAERVPTAVRRTFIRCVRRRLYLKLKRLLFELSKQSSFDLLRRVDSMVAAFARDKISSFKIMFRLYGASWPPVIVYRTSINSLKSVKQDCGTAAAVSDWRVLFSNQPVIIQKPVLFRYSRQSRVIPLENLHIPRRHVRSVSPSQFLKHPPVHKPYEITYKWKTRKQLIHEARPDIRWRFPSYIDQPPLPTFLRVTPSPLAPSSLAIYRAHFNMEEYRAKWLALAVAYVSHKSALS